MKFLYTIFSITLLFNISCKNSGKSKPDNLNILRVPTQFQTIANAVAHSKDGDTIIISPGKYFENSIEINKAITLTSEWKQTGNESIIENTVIDAGDKELFIININDVEISGLKIINGDHSLSISSKVNILHNHFNNNTDAISLESGSGGYVGYNIIKNDRDDGIDIDIGTKKDNIGYDVIIENNTITNSNDDGVEIRLFAWPAQNITYEIRGNVIIGSNNAAIQLISYDVYTGKKFYVHHNVFMRCKTGFGCMEGARTREDMSGASKMDELIFLFNNNFIDNKIGATGGNKIIIYSEGSNGLEKVQLF